MLVIFVALTMAKQKQWQRQKPRQWQWQACSLCGVGHSEVISNGKGCGLTSSMHNGKDIGKQCKHTGPNLLSAAACSRGK